MTFEEVLNLITNGPKMLWILYCVYFLVSSLIKNVQEIDFVFKMRCETCGHEFNALRKDLSMKMEKRVSKSRTQRVLIAAVNITYTDFLSKRIVCPSCGKKQWCEVTNIKEFDENNNRVIFDIVKSFVMRLIIGGAVISICSLLLSFILNGIHSLFV